MMEPAKPRKMHDNLSVFGKRQIAIEEGSFGRDVS